VAERVSNPATIMEHFLLKISENCAIKTGRKRSRNHEDVDESVGVEEEKRKVFVVIEPERYGRNA
jgi:hypothetical protein